MLRTWSVKHKGAKSDKMVQAISSNDEQARRRTTRTLSTLGKVAAKTEGAKGSEELCPQRRRVPFSREKDRQATENVSGFFSLLSAWDAAAGVPDRAA